MIGEQVIDSAMQQVPLQSDVNSVDAGELSAPGFAPRVTVPGEPEDYIAIIAAAYALIEAA